MEEKYVVYTKDGDVVYKNELDKEYVFNNQRFEELLFNECKVQIDNFLKLGVPMYALAVETSEEGGQVGISINTLEDFEKSAKDYEENYGETYAKGGKYYMGLKYGPGNFKYRYFNFYEGEEINSIFNAYYCINVHPLKGATEDIAFETEFFERKIKGEKIYYNDFTICIINVAKKINEYLENIQTDEDFIVFVAEHDVDKNMHKHLNLQIMSEEKFNTMYE